MGPRDGAGEMVRARGVRLIPPAAKLPSPLRERGVGVRGLRRQARNPEALRRATPSSVAYGDTFSRKGRRGRTWPKA